MLARAPRGTRAIRAGAWCCARPAKEASARRELNVIGDIPAHERANGCRPPRNRHLDGAHQVAAELAPEANAAPGPLRRRLPRAWQGQA